MPKFMAVHTLPQYNSEAQLIEYAKTHTDFPAGFAWKQTYCDFASHKFFCEWEAPSKEALAEGFKGLKLPFDAIYPVKLFDVAKKNFVK
jgi:hypothetical protein